MSKQEVEKKPAGDAQSIKETIQSLARQLWDQKRHTTVGVDWLVDGRLRHELDELSKSELTRVNRLLARAVRNMAVRPSTMTAKSA